ncbi:ATP adenylyltransferase C-terminal [Penicillium argentinense]|uniref:ATP adenylyltransferase C-terminal n=1 Tax=Penicillium argentinense TaxID=1131581 RepID=A0A9W9EPG2_9EURO|nr:ATP adenylyltransferase C-terminal [Penicillium argentinense]KAJ5085504.1 ATP adenylyltransferase C-terminal [Penicillium argentinense]
MQLALPENLSALVARRFKAAKDGGHLVFSSTHLSLVTAAGIPFQLRYCPALAKKPTNLKPEPTPKAPKPDPFENPSQDLLIARFPPEKPTHALVLNKFPVIPNHFILATTDWKAQTDILEQADLEATYACLKAWDAEKSASSSKRLFAFFNSGEDSGASQPHRHLQFLPTHSRRSSSPSSSPSFQYIPHLPFAHFALPLPKDADPETLHKTYLTLYRAAVAAAHDDVDGTLRSEGPAAVSYNFAMTLSTMMICPRKQENAQLPVDIAAAGDIVEPGVVSLNGTILAGTLMVKAEVEWDVMRSRPELLGSVLAEVGFSSTEAQMALL